MIYLRILYIFGPLFLVSIVGCPPISPQSGVEDELDSLIGHLDYANYLSQVIKELQGDVYFNKQVADSAEPHDIGNLLKYASGRVRTKLDELKRIEVARLNKLQSEWQKLSNFDSHPLEMPLPPRTSPDASHIHDLDSDSFHPEDLKKLIEKTTQIITKIDAKDEETYKYHEMEKKAEKRTELNKISDDNLRKEEERKLSKEEIKKRSQHKPIHDPGSREHLKSVWKEDDHMDDDSFDTKTFFHMHDLNNDGNWDIAELETLVQRELDKAYDPNNNNTDMIERDHEMTRMRNELLNHIDKDKNHIISLDEYNKWIEGNEFKTDKGWKTQEESEPNFTEEEFEEFYKEYSNRQNDLNQPAKQQPTTIAPS